VVHSCSLQSHTLNGQAPVRRPSSVELDNYNYSIHHSFIIIIIIIMHTMDVCAGSITPGAMFKWLSRISATAQGLL